MTRHIDGTELNNFICLNQVTAVFQILCFHVLYLKYTLCVQVEFYVWLKYIKYFFESITLECWVWDSLCVLSRVHEGETTDRVSFTGPREISQILQRRHSGLTLGTLLRSLTPAMEASVSKDVWKKNRWRNYWEIWPDWVSWKYWCPNKHPHTAQGAKSIQNTEHRKPPHQTTLMVNTRTHSLEELLEVIQLSRKH